MVPEIEDVQSFAAVRAGRERLKRLAIPAGFEPATHGVEIRYSIQLSYGTAWKALYHCQYEKSAFPPRLIRTVFPKGATKPSDGSPRVGSPAMPGRAGAGRRQAKV